MGATGGALWLAGLAVVHVGVCGWPRPRVRIHDTLRHLFIAAGVVCADVAVGLGLQGLAQPAAWGVTAVGFSWLLRRLGVKSDDGPWLGAGVAAHVTLILLRALIALPPAAVTGTPQLAGVASVAIVAAVCLLAGRLAEGWPAECKVALDVIGLLAVACLTLASLFAGPLVAAWAAEAAALAEISRRTEDRGARIGALCFLGVAAAHAVVREVPPVAFIHGSRYLGNAAVALGALALACLRVGTPETRDPRLRLGLLAGAGLAALALGSVAIVSVFQPDGGAGTTTFLGLGVRQTGQVLLSGLWGVVGVIGLVVGLRLRMVPLRLAMLGLLLVTVGKVFLFDLSVLTSIYRVASLFVLGALLLVGALAYQRLRPPPVPDIREVHHTQRWSGAWGRVLAPPQGGAVGRVPAAGQAGRRELGQLGAEGLVGDEPDARQHRIADAVVEVRGGRRLAVQRIEQHRGARHLEHRDVGGVDPERLGELVALVPGVEVGAAVEPDPLVRQLVLVLQEVARAGGQLDGGVAEHLAFAVGALREDDLVAARELGRRDPDERDLLERAIQFHLVLLAPVAH